MNSTRCEACPGLLFSLNLCPLGLFLSQPSLLPEEQLSPGLESLIILAGLYHWITIASVLFGLLILRTTRAFCMTACLGISFVMVNHLTGATVAPRPPGSPFLLRKLRQKFECISKSDIHFVRVSGHVVFARGFQALSRLPVQAKQDSRLL